jgi:hypothetical protein
VSGLTADRWTRQEDQQLLDAMRRAAPGKRSRAAVAAEMAKRLTGRSALGCERRIRTLLETVLGDAKPEVVPRRCLRCRDTFQAPRVIFVCEPCKNSVEWRAGTHA